MGGRCLEVKHDPLGKNPHFGEKRIVGCLHVWRVDEDDVARDRVHSADEWI